MKKDSSCPLIDDAKNHLSMQLLKTVGNTILQQNYYFHHTSMVSMSVYFG